MSRTEWERGAAIGDRLREIEGNLEREREAHERAQLLREQAELYRELEQLLQRDDRVLRSHRKFEWFNPWMLEFHPPLLEVLAAAEDAGFEGRPFDNAEWPERYGQRPDELLAGVADPATHAARRSVLYHEVIELSSRLGG